MENRPSDDPAARGDGSDWYYDVDLHGGVVRPWCSHPRCERLRERAPDGSWSCGHRSPDSRREAALVAAVEQLADTAPVQRTAADEFWERLAGPFTDVAGAAERLGCAPVEVAERIACRELLGCRLADADATWVLPEKQFDVLDALPQVLARAGYRPHRAARGWEIVGWLASPNDHLDGLTVYEALVAGRSDEVLALAAIVNRPADGPLDTLSQIQDIVSTPTDGPGIRSSDLRPVLRQAALEMLEWTTRRPREPVDVVDRLDEAASWLETEIGRRGQGAVLGPVVLDVRRAMFELQRPIDGAEADVAARVEIHAAWLERNAPSLYGVRWNDLRNDLIAAGVQLRRRAADRVSRPLDRAADATEVVTRYLVVDVVAVKVLARYVVELTFDDGFVGVVDLEGWLRGSAFEPVRADYANFLAVRVNSDSGTIEFPNGADLSPSALYLAAKPSIPD
ncbi:DUF2442 domain-containing protein [Dermatobacter hominis]|uniref:DUF2442 domain-containing protein n=1 Tax=Dermatobacter hominis TaxID=2884263 RepID=UPI001D118269|nr:DUF2442 domain-containing protein [Dermatobacter hominis]UDY34024.1 DUF2442 domain-containing protein [Dermatobacter hominis]